MRALRFLNLSILAALIASSAVLYAQDEKQQEDKPRQEEPKRQEAPSKQDKAKPESKQDEMKAPRQDEAKPARPEQPEQRQGEMQPREEARPAQQEPARQEPARQEARPEEHARPAGNGGRIPDDRFRAQFGREHHFAMHRPEVVSGRPQFQYGGYNFVLVDAWPPDWAYSDDCYIDYVDGEYFLFNLRHPGVRLALTVVM